MSYLSLARKYRPQTFGDMVGQEHVVTALANAIRLGRKPHSVIFSGVRGVGKTTVARLYAKALNCQHPDQAPPCNQCESCLAINQGTHEDVVEIDGASHTGVDDIRAIQEALGYVPQRSSYKIYIIDEVHMLSQSAFNALLKTLEEPPAHVVFMFATTELRKVPATILSRCQTYHLQLIPMGVIVERLQYILQLENIPFEPGAIELIAREGQGSLRDSLTLMDQMIALTAGNLTMAQVRPLLVTQSSYELIAFIDALVSRDPERALAVIQTWEQQGAVLKDILEQVCQFVRHAFVVRDLGIDKITVAHLGLDPTESEYLQTTAKKAAAFDLNRIFRTLIKCRTELDGAALDRFILENYVLEWCLDPGFPDMDELLVGGKVVHNVALQDDRAGAVTTAPKARSKPKDLMSAFHQNIAAAEAKPVTPPVVDEPPPPVEPTQPEAKVFPPSWRELVDAWKAQKPLQARILEETWILHYSRERIEIAVHKTSLAGARLLQKDVNQKVLVHLRELFGFQGQFMVREREGEANTVAPAPGTDDESLLDVKRREKEASRQKMQQDLAAHPLTQQALAAFNGTIGGIELQ